MSLTQEQFKALFPNASRSFIERNSEATKPPVRPTPRAADAGYQEARPIVEPHLRANVHTTVQGASGNSAKHLLCYELRRCRLISDSENIATKAFTDAFRYFGLIPEDNYSSVEIQVTQQKVATKAQECTIVTIYPPGTW